MTLLSLTTRQSPKPKQVRKVSNGTIFQREGPARLHHQKPRCIARARRPQRDTLGGQIKIKEVGLHTKLSS